MQKYCGYAKPIVSSTLLVKRCCKRKKCYQPAVYSDSRLIVSNICFLGRPNDSSGMFGIHYASSKCRMLLLNWTGSMPILVLAGCKWLRWGDSVTWWSYIAWSVFASSKGSIGNHQFEEYGALSWHSVIDKRSSICSDIKARIAIPLRNMAIKRRRSAKTFGIWTSMFL